MFKCGLCNEQSKPNEKPVRFATETRDVKYPAIYKAHRYINRDGVEVVKDDPGGNGFETAVEVNAHKKCVPRVEVVGLAV